MEVDDKDIKKFQQANAWLGVVGAKLQEQVLINYDCFNVDTGVLVVVCLFCFHPCASGSCRGFNCNTLSIIDCGFDPFVISVVVCFYF